MAGKSICFFGTPSNTKHNKNAGTYTLIFHPHEEIKSYNYNKLFNTYAFWYNPEVELTA